jgi:Uma2 family endonuclease
MAGASVRHNRISRNVLNVFQNKLRGSDCEAFGSDMRIHTPGGLWTYPDVMVVCGELQIRKEKGIEAICNPRLLVEVLSDSTRDYDRNDKFALCRAIPDFCEYVLIEQDSLAVEQYVLGPRTDRAKKRSWKMRRHTDPAAPVKLASLPAELTFAEIYEQTGLF